MDIASHTDYPDANVAPSQHSSLGAIGCWWKLNGGTLDEGPGYGWSFPDMITVSFVRLSRIAWKKWTHMDKDEILHAYQYSCSWASTFWKSFLTLLFLVSYHVFTQALVCAAFLCLSVFDHTSDVDKYLLFLQALREVSHAPNPRLLCQCFGAAASALSRS